MMIYGMSITCAQILKCNQRLLGSTQRHVSSISYGQAETGNLGMTTAALRLLDAFRIFFLETEHLGIPSCIRILQEVMISSTQGSLE